MGNDIVYWPSHSDRLDFAEVLVPHDEWNSAFFVLPHRGVVTAYETPAQVEDGCRQVPGSPPPPEPACPRFGTGLPAISRWPLRAYSVRAHS